MRSSSTVLLAALTVACGSAKEAGGMGGAAGASGSGGAAGAGSGGGAGAFEFTPYAGRDTDPDVTTERLCPAWADPEAAPDKVFIDCELEGGSFAPTEVAPKAELVVYTYNFERGVALDRQIALLRDDPAVPRADIILGNELDRGCSRSGTRNTPRELARALGMNYVFGVEFVELPRGDGSGGTITETCEHGNAVFSRYPLGNVGALRHTQNKSWYLPPEDRADGEPRLGGRVLVYADTLVGEHPLHLHALHYESSPLDNAITTAQAEETAELGLTRPHQVLHGGDTNAPYYWLDLRSPDAAPTDRVTQAFFTRGYHDAHAPLAAADRGTRNGLVLDLLFGSGAFFSDPGICDAALCGELSDHLPVWATVTVAP